MFKGTRTLTLTLLDCKLLICTKCIKEIKHKVKPKTNVLSKKTG